MGKTGSVNWMQIKGVQAQIRLVPEKDSEVKKPGPNQRFKGHAVLKKLERYTREGESQGSRGGGRSGGRNMARYAQRYLSIIQKYTTSGKLLDVGSSVNPFPSIAAENGYNVSVLDYAKPEGLSFQVNFIISLISGSTLKCK